MTRILILKTNALGDVLRTTSILPGIRAREPAAELTWVTSLPARDLIAGNELLQAVEVVEPDDATDVDRAVALLSKTTWDRVLSFDDDEGMCRLASSVPSRSLSGASLDRDGQRGYTDDFAPWFGMGLIARDGRVAADRRKIANRRSHAAIFAGMLGIAPARPQLSIDEPRLERARARLSRGDAAVLVGLNTGSGDRWPTKALPEERVVDIVARLSRSLGHRARYVLFGGPEERTRNVRLSQALAQSVPEAAVVDVSTENPVLEFAALVSACDLLVTSDSLGMHVAIACHVPVVAFFAPTSAAEIELFGPGEKVSSTSPDYCSYRPDADNSTITAERVCDAVMRVLSVTRPDVVSSGV